MIRQTPYDPVGVGIKSPMSFAGGGLNLTAKTRVKVVGDAGIGDGPQTFTREVISATNEERRQAITQAMNRIALTPQKSRFMDGGYGSLVPDFVFETNEDWVWALAASYAALAIWSSDNRVVVQQAWGEASDDEEYAFIVHVAYSVKGTSLLGEAQIGVVQQ